MTERFEGLICLNWYFLIISVVADSVAFVAIACIVDNGNN